MGPQHCRRSLVRKEIYSRMTSSFICSFSLRGKVIATTEEAEDIVFADIGDVMQYT